MEELKIKLRRLLEKPEWTDEDKQWLLQYLENTEATEFSTLILQKYSEGEWPPRKIDPEISKEMLEAIHEKLGLNTSFRKKPLRRIWAVRVAAASLFGLLAIGVYWGMNNNKNEMAAIQSPRDMADPGLKSDVSPGGNRAVLILADGSSISLNDAKNGALAQQGNTKILKLNGQLSYSTTKNAGNEVYYNTIATPRGGEFEVELPDGTKAWLNAASSLRFPTAFVGSERRVEITGEVYFEVTKNASMPFFVKAGNSEVQVLGTHFNVMAYGEESFLKTTLLEGSVKFVSNGKVSLLAPGQQSKLNKDGSVSVENDIDVADVLAWKNGLFHFEGVDIKTVMRQLARWYDVDIVYENKEASDNLFLFYAEIPRNTNLSDALKALQLTGKVHFLIEGRKIIVIH